MHVTSSNAAIQCRRALFHIQVQRFRCIAFRAPDRIELRVLWQSTKFAML